MMNFDDRIKAIAKNEAAHVPDGFAERMDSLADNLATQSAKNRPRLRPMQVAAIIAAVCVLAGGTVYAGVTKWLSFNWDGTEEPSAIMEEVPGEDWVVLTTEFEDYSAYVADLAPNEVYRVTDTAASTSESSGSNSTYLYSQDEMEHILANAVTPFELPAIPEGYRFKEARIDFGLSPDFIDPNTAPTRTQQLADGKVLEIFSLPDGYQRYVDNYTISYIDENGIELVFTAMLSQKSSHSSFGASQLGTAEKLEIPGFSKVLFIDDADDEQEHFQSLYTAKDIDELAVMTVFELNYQNTSYAEHNAPFEPIIMNKIHYAVHGTGVSKQLLVDLMESLQRPQ